MHLKEFVCANIIHRIAECKGLIALSHDLSLPILINLHPCFTRATFVTRANSILRLFGLEATRVCLIRCSGESAGSLGPVVQPLGKGRHVYSRNINWNISSLFFCTENSKYTVVTFILMLDCEVFLWSSNSFELHEDILLE